MKKTRLFAKLQGNRKNNTSLKRRRARRCRLSFSSDSCSQSMKNWIEITCNALQLRNALDGERLIQAVLSSIKIDQNRSSWVEPLKQFGLLGQNLEVTEFVDTFLRTAKAAKHSMPALSLRQQGAFKTSC